MNQSVMKRPGLSLHICRGTVVLEEGYFDIRILIFDMEIEMEMEM